MNRNMFPTNVNASNNITGFQTTSDNFDKWTEVALLINIGISLKYILRSIAVKIDWRSL